MGFIIKCAWCGLIMQNAAPVMDEFSNTYEPQVSRTACAPCTDKMLNEIAARRAA